MWRREVIQEALAAMGFSRLDDRNEYRSGEFCFLADFDRASLTAPGSAGANSGDDLLLGRPGLWKKTSIGTAFHDVFHLALNPNQNTDLPRAAEDESPASLLRSHVTWAMATFAGNSSPQWQPPPVDLIQEFVPDSALTLQVGPLVSKGSLIHQPNRLALTFSLGKFTDEPSRARRKCMDALLRDANQRWMLPRVGYCDANRSVVLAEVDLTGMPHALVSTLLPIAFDGLRYVVEWLAEPVSLISDARAANELFEALEFGL